MYKCDHAKIQQPKIRKPKPFIFTVWRLEGIYVTHGIKLFATLELSPLKYELCITYCITTLNGFNSRYFSVTATASDLQLTVQ